MQDIRNLAARLSAVSYFGEFRRNESGVTAIETALVMPVFLLLLLGIIHAGLLIFTQASLHYAVEKRVRCVAVSGASACPAASTHYFGPGATPVFTDIAPSGSQKCQALSGVVTYNFDLGLWQRNVSLSSKACFPDIYHTPST